jgi:hypothetical protein
LGFEYPILLPICDIPLKVEFEKVFDALFDGVTLIFSLRIVDIYTKNIYSKKGIVP